MSWSDVELMVSAACMSALTNVTAQIELASGTITVPGVFDRTYIDANGIAGTGPLLRCESPMIRGVRTGIKVHFDLDAVGNENIESATYKVVEVKPDGSGITDLILQESA